MNRTPRPSDLNRLEEIEAMLQAENKQLAAKIESLKALLEEKVDCSNKAIAALWAENKRLTADLLKYGRHSKSCKTYIDGLPILGCDKGVINCTCGWIAKQKELERENEEKSR